MAGWWWNYDMTLLQYVFFAKQVEEEYGGWPVSLSMYRRHMGPYVEPRFAGVWHWRPGKPHHPPRYALITIDELPQKLEQWANMDVFPRLASAASLFIPNVGANVYLSLVGDAGPETLLTPRVPLEGLFTDPYAILKAQFGYKSDKSWHQQQYWDGYHPISLSIYHDSATRMAIVWEKQPAKRNENGWYYWNLKVIEDSRIQEADAVFKDGFASPHLACPIQNLSAPSITWPQSGALNHFVLYRDDKVPSSQATYRIPSDQLEVLLGHFGSLGYWPLSLQGTKRYDSQVFPGSEVFDLVVARAGHTKERPRVLQRRRIGGDLAGGIGGLSSSMEQTSGELGSDLSQSLEAPQPFPTTLRHHPAYPRMMPTVRPGAVRLQGGERASLPKAPELPQGMTQYSGLEPPTESVTDAPSVFQPLEDYIVAHMKKYSIRGGQLVVCRGGELKYAVGLTWAEDDYPIVTPTKRMRMGSLSKTVTAFAVHRLVEILKKQNIELDIFSIEEGHNIGSILGVTHDGWDKRSIAHLILHLAYFDRDKVGQATSYYNVANWLQKPPPTPAAPVIDRKDMYDFIVQHEGLPGTYFLEQYIDNPPSPTINKLVQPIGLYDGFNYERLGDVIGIKRYSAAEKYEDFVREEIFEHLGTNRPRRGVETAAQAWAERFDEVWYHAFMPDLWSSLWHAGGTEGNLKPFWGAPAYEGHSYRIGLAGGQWSLAMVDYARLLSSVDIPGALLEDPISLERLFERTYAQGATMGFGATYLVPKPPSGPGHLPGPAPAPGPGPSLDDWWKNMSKETHNAVSFGGLWMGTWAYTFRRNDSVVLVVAFNGEPPVGLDANHMSQLLDFPEQLWPTWDLFPLVLGA